MNQPTALSLDGGWEKLVNNVERHNARARIAAKREKRRRDRMVGCAINLSLGAVLAITLDFAGLVAPWVAGVTAVLLVCGASFLVGRIYEATKQ